MPATHPLSVQLYSFRHVSPPDRPAVLRQLREAGYGAVEPFGHPDSAPRLREELGAAGLEVSSLHGSPQRHGLDRVAGSARTLGTDTIIVPSVDHSRWRDRAGVEGLAAELNELAAGAAEQGLRIGYHNHDFEFSPLGDGTALEVLAGSLAPEVVLELDTYWAAVAGQDVPALVARLGDRVRYLHLKDGPADDRTAPMTALGRGRMPIGEILAAGGGVEWNVVELDECATDMLDAVVESAAWLRDRALA